MSILNPWDITFMKESVRDIIEGWQTKITFMQPKTLDEQENYDNLLHEFVGDAEYEFVTTIAERKDIVNNYTNNLAPQDTEFGENDDGTYLYAVPDILPVYKNGKQVGIKKWKPSNDAILVIDDTDDRYQIVHMRERIGETLVQVQRYTGNIPYGSDVELPEENKPYDGLKQEDEYVDPEIPVDDQATLEVNTEDLININTNDNDDVNIIVVEEGDW